MNNLEPPKDYILIVIKKIKYVDGYKINLKNIENNKLKNEYFLMKK